MHVKVAVALTMFDRSQDIAQFFHQSRVFQVPRPKDAQHFDFGAHIQSAGNDTTVCEVQFQKLPDDVLKDAFQAAPGDDYVANQLKLELSHPRLKDHALWP